jgi:putative transposase
VLAELEVVDVPVSRRFVALSTAKLKELLAAELSPLDLLVIQIDGLRVDEHVLVAAVGIDGAGHKHVLAVALGATENAAVVKALLADLVARGLKPDIARLRPRTERPRRSCAAERG